MIKLNEEHNRREKSRRREKCLEKINSKGGNGMENEKRKEKDRSGTLYAVI